MAKIAIIEDDVMLAEIYQTSLALEGFNCLVAHDGRTGLALIQREMPDLVLLDIMLPEMGGDEVLSAMRASDWGKDIKVLVLTNISKTEAPEAFSRLHFEDYLVKANNTPDQIVGTVKRILQVDTPAVG